MPTHTIPLAQTATARGWVKSTGTSAKDAQVINGFFEVSTNPLIGTKTVYVTKRAGSSIRQSSVGGGPIVAKYYGTDLGPLYITSTGDVVNDGGDDLGNVGGHPQEITNYILADAIISDVEVVAFNTDTNGWYLYSDAITDNFPTFSASLTSGQATIVGIASTTGIYSGQAVSGSGVPASTLVSDILSSSTVLLSANATESGTKTITKEAVAKITDAQYPSPVGGIVTMDGYFFAAALGSIYQSAINDPSSWATADVIGADYSSDRIAFLFRVGQYVVAAGNGGTIQYFYNNGNSTGTVLSRADHLNLTGLYLECQPVPFGDAQYLIASPIGSISQRGLYRLTGVNTFTRVSDDVWSSIISDVVIARIGTAHIGTKDIVLIHSDSDNPCIAYDPSTGGFSFVQTPTSITSAHSLSFAFTRASSTNALAWATGNTWTDDDSANYTLTIQTDQQDPAQGHSVTDTWIDLLADIESTGTATISVSDDDYQNWTTKGTFDMTKNKKRVHALGFHDGPRAYRLQHSANTGFRGQVLRVNVDPSSL